MGAPPKPGPLRDAIAGSIAREVKAYDVAAFCEGLGLAAQREGEDPFRSKFTYVKSRLQERRLPELLDIARAVLAEWDDDDLEQLVARGGAAGVAGELKNLIFASTGPKPQIVLRDALNNTVEITRGADTCLIYTRSLPEAGLTWASLAEWWATEILHDTNLDVAQRHLYQRLCQSLASPPEQLLFRTYADRFVTHPDVAALLPQVYLHYDPYVRRWPEERPGSVVRQRMDFLLLLSQRRRIVLEVDGRHHYATENGTADPQQYARMLAEDRRLRLAGYEVYRFGGAELSDEEQGRTLLHAFFDKLLDDRPQQL
jgi:very-short-patch-repair endonuclease